MILIGIAIMLLFAGCTGTSSTKKNGYSLDGAFNGGNEGLDIEFTDGQPPAKIRDGGLQPFTIRAMITNKGEYDVPEGHANVVLSGISYSDFNVANISQVVPALRGVKKQGTNVINGAIQPVMYSNLKYMPQLPSGIHTQKIFLDMCYPYETSALISLCISGSTLQSFDSDLKVCDVESTRKYANSGAPVIIENVKQTPAGTSSIMLQFDIVHKKAASTNGRVYKSGSLDYNCKVYGKSVSSTDADIYENYVKYEVDTGIEGIDCGGTSSNTGEVLLSNDRTTVYCTQSTVGEEDYERPISVKLSYDYFDRISKDIQIEHISQ